MKGKELNKRVGVFKKQFKMGRADFEPGTLINKLKESQKVNKVEKTLPLKTKVSIMGLV